MMSKRIRSVLFKQSVLFVTLNLQGHREYMQTLKRKASDGVQEPSGCMLQFQLEKQNILNLEKSIVLSNYAELSRGLFTDF